MKILMKSELMVLAKCEPTKSKDGQTTYYKLLVMQGQEAGQLNCPESAYFSVRVGEKTVFNLEYNSEYKSLKLLGIAASPNFSEPSPADTAPAPTSKASAPAENSQPGGTKK